MTTASQKRAAASGQQLTKAQLATRTRADAIQRTDSAASGAARTKEARLAALEDTLAAAHSARDAAALTRAGIEWHESSARRYYLLT